MKKLIVIADWVSDSLTCQEVKSAVEGFAKDPNQARVSFIASTPSTLHTAFLLQQAVEIEERYGQPLETVFFVNTDPRIQSKKSVEHAKGAEFVVIRLSSGTYICGPNAGYCFSLLREKITNIFLYPGLDKGSQFRSRDLYSRVAAHLMDAMEDDLDLEETHTNLISIFQGYYVGHIDNYGNIKTTITHEELKGKYNYGDVLSICIKRITKSVKYVSNLFGGVPGELVIYPGSSGKTGNPYLEISVWRHFTEEDRTTGSYAFQNPLPGTEVTLIK